jgi:hypothetical protein
MSFARFMAGPIGRGVRVVAGIALIVIGIVVGSVGGVILAVVGAVALSPVRRTSASSARC